MIVATLYLPFFLSGFLWGVYLCTVAFLYAFVSKPIHAPQGRLTEEDVQKVSEEIDRQEKLQLTAVYKVRAIMRDAAVCFDCLHFSMQFLSILLLFRIF